MHPFPRINSHDRVRKILPFPLNLKRGGEISFSSVENIIFMAIRAHVVYVAYILDRASGPGLYGRWVYQFFMDSSLDFFLLAIGKYMRALIGVSGFIQIRIVLHHLFIASAFSSFGINSIAYLKAVLGITALFCIT